MRRLLWAGMVSMTGCMGDPMADESAIRGSAAPVLVRLDEPGTQGITAAEGDAAQDAMAALAATAATQFVVTRTQAGLRSLYRVAYPGNATGFVFERRQTAAGTHIDFLEEGNTGFDPLLAAGEFNYATAVRLPSDERDDAFPAWASGLAALFDNRDAGDAVWIPAWCVQGDVAETGMAGANLRVPFDVTWPARGAGASITQTTAAAFGPTLGRLLGAPPRETVRDGVARNDGTLAWEDAGPLDVPPAVAERAVLFLYRGLPFAAWADLRANGLLPGWLAAVRDRDLLQVRQAVVHGPADAQAGEIEWLTGAIPAHAGYLDGKLDRRSRVSTLGELVGGDWRVYGGRSGLARRTEDESADDAGRLRQAAHDPAKLVVVLLDAPAEAYRRGDDTSAALVQSSEQVATFIEALKRSGRLERTVLAFGATHGMARCTGGVLAPPAAASGLAAVTGLP